ncbi:MAG: YcaO-like family protein [Labilithrix sp.]|nr:YcaO-like family protein [Labilithrix sp.]
MRPRSETESLRLRLPEGWSAPDSCEDVIVADGLAIRRAGVSSVAPDGEEVTGSAALLEHDGASADDISPASKSCFELLERVSLIEAMRASTREYALLTADGRATRTCAGRELFPESDAPERWRPARSNGVAIHADWSRACERALWELAERDRVLASWYGHVRPERLDGDVHGVSGVTSSYDWSAWAFPEERDGSFSRGLEVVGVFGFPTRAGAPLAMGFAARPHRRDALDDATREAIQLLGFLWGEPVAEMTECVEPTAMGHLDFYQAPERHPLLRSWLAGEHIRYACAAGSGTNRVRASTAEGERAPASGARVDREEVVFADLTPVWLGSGERVAKAVCTSAHRLVFGESALGAHLPPERRIHPIS